MKNQVSTEILELAQKIAIYQGFKGTPKQIERYLKMYQFDLQLMKQYANNRIK